MDWTSVINTPTTDRSGNDPANTALFDLGTDREFDLIWGVSTIGNENFNRGWNISLEAKLPLSGEPVPEIDGPVLVQVGFALAGLYVLMLGRRRSGEDMEMSQAAA